MRKISLVLILVLLLAILAGCTGEIQIKDGTYRAEYADFDQQGYKEFVEITFEGGRVVEINADAVDVNGNLKSESEEFREAMEPISGTYPEKYYRDLINQYLENPSSDSIDIVAGATTSSNSFIVLLKALERAVRTGNTDTVVVDRP